jgi:hypothetical protein
MKKAIYVISAFNDAFKPIRRGDVGDFKPSI